MRIKSLTIIVCCLFCYGTCFASLIGWNFISIGKESEKKRIFTMRLRGNSLHTELIYDSNNRFVRMNLFSLEAIACFVLLFSIGCLALFFM